MTEILSNHKLAEERTSGKILKAHSYCIRFSLLDILAHDDVHLDHSTPHMIGRQSFWDFQGLVQSSSEELFLEVRGTLVSTVVEKT